MTVKTTHMMMFRDEVQLFTTRTDSFSSERADAMKLTWTIDEDGLLLTKQEITSTEIKETSERIPWSNIKQYRVTTTRPVDGSKSKR